MINKRFEFGSILKFAETVFNLSTIGPASQGYTDAQHGTDTSINGIGEAFNFNQQPLPFIDTDAPYSESFFLTQTTSLRAPDEH